MTAKDILLLSTQLQNSDILPQSSVALQRASTQRTTSHGTLFHFIRYCKRFFVCVIDYFE